MQPLKKTFVAFVLLIATCLQPCHTQGAAPLQLIEALSAESTVPFLNTASYRKIITSSERDFHVLVVFTALQPEQSCKICKAFDKEVLRFGKALKNYRYSLPKPLYIVNVDVKDAEPIFSEYELEYAPIVNFMKANENKNKKPVYDSANNYDMYENDMTAEGLAEFVRQQIGYEIPLKTESASIYQILAASTVLLLTTIWHINSYFGGLENLKKIRHSWKTWFAMSLIWMFFCLAGTVFNLIRKPPLVSVNHRTGGMVLFAPGQSNQTIAEGAIISAMFIVFSSILIAIHSLLERKANKWVIRILGVFFTLLLLLCYYGIRFAFKMKNPWYMR